MNKFETTLENLKVGSHFKDESRLYKLVEKKGMTAKAVDCATGETFTYYIECIVEKCEGLSLYLAMGGRDWM